MGGSCVNQIVEFLAAHRLEDVAVAQAQACDFIDLAERIAVILELENVPYRMIDMGDICANLINILDELETVQHTTENANMAEFNLTIETHTYVNGLRASDMSKNEFLARIKSVNDEIKRLNDLDIDTPVLTAEIVELGELRNQLVLLLEAHHGTPAEAE